MEVAMSDNHWQITYPQGMIKYVDFSEMNFSV